jgi:transposase InsO family protein
LTVDLQLIAKALGKTKRAVEIRCKRETWAHREEAVRGGRRKIFALADLPKEVARAVERHRTITSRAESSTHVMRVLADLEAQAMEARDERQAKGEQNLKKLMEPLAQSVQARFDGRYAIVKSWERWFPTVQPMGKKASYWAYVMAFNAGDMDVGADVREKFGTISARSLQRWLITYEKEGMAGLIDHKDGKAQRDVNVFTRQPALEKAAIALLIARPSISMRDMETLLKQAAVDQGTGEVLFEAPSYWAVARFVNAWKKKNAELYTAATNPDEWKNKYMVAFGDASEDVVRLNQRWEMDATPADWMLQDEDGGLRRYSMSVVIDVYSRRTLVVLAPTPKTETHKLALRLAILLWGVPEEIVTDNGKDYKSRDFVATLDALKIAHHVTAPFSPWEKPHVERMNQTLLHSILEVFSSFIGHNVAERSAIEARASFAERLFSKEAKLIEMAMPAPLLQARINQWLAGIYEQQEHSSLGMSPFAKAAAYRAPVRRIDDERALDVLLAQPAGKGSYVVTKKGLRIQKAQFIALELALLVGKTVDVRLTDDYGHVVVYHEGKFVCVARCPERSGVSRQEVASHARQLQRKNVQQLRREAKSTKVDPDALVSSLLREKAEAAGKLATIPTPASSHRTAALAAAGQAARTLDGAVSTTEVPGELRAIMDKRRDNTVDAGAAPQASARVTVIPETPQQRFRKWLELDELLSNGGTIEDPKLTRWYGSYPQTAEHASMYKRHQQSLVAPNARSAGPDVREFKSSF